ncbi:11853_t:CDS:1 [Diversispora eburnea]|uniref:11853_t:CDS:1 n=1 Tax=Diversispora eburnea TaxID=1213867 RepID=A0A9N8ZYG3_9GLOM|nr:11853_t:CDS:1 [Diversispora eburnea]
MDTMYDDGGACCRFCQNCCGNVKGIEKEAVDDCIEDLDACDKGVNDVIKISKGVDYCNKRFG